MKNAMNGMPGIDNENPFKDGNKEVEIDPSKFKIDPEVMEAFT